MHSRKLFMLHFITLQPFPDADQPSKPDWMEQTLHRCSLLLTTQSPTLPTACPQQVNSQKGASSTLPSVHGSAGEQESLSHLRRKTREAAWSHCCCCSLSLSTTLPPYSSSCLSVNLCTALRLRRHFGFLFTRLFLHHCRALRSAGPIHPPPRPLRVSGPILAR